MGPLHTRATLSGLRRALLDADRFISDKGGANFSESDGRSEAGANDVSVDPLELLNSLHHAYLEKTSDLWANFYRDTGGEREELESERNPLWFQNPFPAHREYSSRQRGASKWRSTAECPRFYRIPMRCVQPKPRHLHVSTSPFPIFFSLSL